MKQSFRRRPISNKNKRKKTSIKPSSRKPAPIAKPQLPADLTLYKIETGIKIPPIAKASSISKISAAVATMNALGKGQSFLIEDPADAFTAAKQMRDVTRRERQRNGTRAFVSRKVGAGLRIWRVS